jgi:5-methylcytosine-specific restriction endonuclease McrA
MTEQQFCRVCGEMKPVAEFPTWKNRRGEKLPRTECRACKNLRTAGWKKANPEKHAEWGRKWRGENLEKARDIERRWRGRNRDKVNAKNERYRAARPEKTRQLQTERQNRRRARLRAAFVAPVDRQVVFERDGWVCGICGQGVDPLTASVDHIVPLAAGGTHEPSNVQTAHMACNRQKGASL